MTNLDAQACNEIADYIRIGDPWAKAIEKTQMRRMLNANELCPVPPEQCDGKAKVNGRLFQCPFVDTQECPYHQQRQRIKMQRFLKRIGVPVDAQNPRWDRVPDSYRDQLRLYADTIGERIVHGDGLILAGGVGCGKTCALALIADSARGGYAVEYRYAADLYDALHNQDGKVQTARGCDLLLVDDWGTEYPSRWAGNRFQQLINHRHGNRKSTCLTMNMSIAAIKEKRELQRIYDRLRERNAVLETTAESQRQPMSTQKWLADTTTASKEPNDERSM